jgi:endonuclease/exonuclease/phosphatase (EEP) superfamily protein YafD
LKGYQRVAIRTPEGAEVDFYNTHLDSGSGRRSVELRARQLEVLARAIEARPKSRAVIVGGDFNSVFNRSSDRPTILKFRSRLDLRDSGAGPELRNWRERDYIFYRDGADTKLEVERAGEAGEFVEKDQALSDHPAVYARFRVTSLVSAEEEGP